MALAFLLWVPMGVSHGDAVLVTGHSTFYDGDGFSPCLASLAGIMRSRVMWFNDQVLVETYGGKGTYLYVTEQGAPDPRAEVELYTEGVFYDFVDPNGAHWHVEENYYDKVSTLGVTIDQSGTVPGVEANKKVDRTMVWIVELAARPVFDEFAGDSPHSYYNFLTIVDTCKMHRNNATFNGELNHTREGGDINDRNGHRNDDKDHSHESFMVDLWMGKKPVRVIPDGASTDGAMWESDWAQGTARESAPADSADGGIPEAP